MGVGKLHCDHRVVIRDPDQKIIFDEPFASFASAKPEYELQRKSLAAGYELTLQHGARIIFKTTGSV